MITHIQGRLTEKNPAYAIIDCNGVGYYINISLNTFSKIGKDEFCKLYTHLSIREDAQTLYGFADQEERSMFRLLISVSGVGANTARMILSSLNPAEVQQAIATSDVNTLKGIKGIGAKSAQRIIVDLTDKIGKEDILFDNVSVSGNTMRNEALSALITLGFDKKKAEKTLDKSMKEAGEVSVEELIKITLKNL
jgi:Holliday junction DNA helicase RuvA